MSEIKINTGRTNTQTHRAVLQPEQIKQILADRVCEAAAVPAMLTKPVSASISAVAWATGSEYEAIVTVAIDYQKTDVESELPR